MEKVYLLLRQNIQSGPFTLDELADLQLQPTDLIWIEGESQSWNTPASISDDGKGFRGPDTNDWVSPRGDEGRRAPDQRGSQASLAIEAATVPSGRSGTYRDPEDIELIVHKKGGATVSLVQLLGVAAVTALLALAWDNRFKLLQTQEEAISYASAPVIFVPRSPEHIPKPAATTFIAADSSSKLRDQSINEVQTGVKSKKNTSKPSGAKAASPVLIQPVQETEVQEMNDALPIVDPTDTKIIDTPVTAPQDGIEEGGETVKKKTLGQAIKGLFKKKNKEGKKKEEKVDQE